MTSRPIVSLEIITFGLIKKLLMDVLHQLILLWADKSFQNS